MLTIFKKIADSTNIITIDDDDAPVGVINTGNMPQIMQRFGSYCDGISTTDLRGQKRCIGHNGMSDEMSHLITVQRNEYKLILTS